MSDQPDLYLATRRAPFSLVQRAVMAELLLRARSAGKAVFRVNMTDLAACLGSKTAESTARKAIKSLSPHLVTILDKRNGVGPKLDVSHLLSAMSREPTPPSALRHLWDAEHSRPSMTEPDEAS